MGNYKFLNRFTTLPYAIDFLKNEKLVLLNPENWEDKNEKVTLQAYKKLKDKKSIYCLCLADSTDNIHHWNSFANSEFGCFLKFNMKKIQKFVEENGLLMDNMEYIKISNLSKLNINMEKLPFYKRYPFRPEEEVRILKLDDQEQKAVFEVPCNVNIVESITLSDKIPQEIATFLKEKIKKINPNFKGDVYQSTLNKNDNWFNKFSKL